MQGVPPQGEEFPVNTQQGGAHGLQMKIRSSLLDHEAEQVVDAHEILSLRLRRGHTPVQRSRLPDRNIGSGPDGVKFPPPFDVDPAVGYTEPSMTGPVLTKRLGNLTLANQLTFLRLVAVPFFILAILQAHFDWAFAIFVLAGITDLLDGLLARILRQRTALGAYLDPAADKILLVAAFVLLTEYPAMFRGIPMTNRIPIWLTVLMISRDVFIVTVALMMYLAYGISRFHPSVWGKITTVAEIVMIGCFLLANHLEKSHPVLDGLVLVVLLCVLVSGVHYLWRTVRRVRAEGVDPHHRDTGR